MTTSFHEVPGLLEHILSFTTTHDLLSTALVCHRWKSISRDDSVWRPVYKRTLTAEGDEDDDDDIPLFWRSLFAESVVQRMSKQQILGILNHPLVAGGGGGEEDNILPTLDLTELQRRLLQHIHGVAASNSSISIESRVFSDLFFGAYACLVRDSKRQTILPVELNSHLGFELFFKVAEEDFEPTDAGNMPIPYEDLPGILLHYHSICYFRGNHSFEVDEPSYRNNGLSWRCLNDGKFVQVAQYPPLLITRQRDRRWKLENIYVIFLSRTG